MYKVMILPLAEQDIIQNTDYIVYEKKAPETAVKLAQGLRKAIADLEFMEGSTVISDDTLIEEISKRLSKSSSSA